MRCNDIAAAIFDFDGTLFDSMYIWRELPAKLVRAHGGTPPENMLGIIAPMLLTEMIEWMRRELLPQCDAAALLRELNEMVWREYNEVVRPKSGALEGVTALRRHGIPTCIVSATESAMIAAALQRCGAAGSFDFLLFADDYGGKTRPECYLEAARRMGVEPANTLVFEDALHAARTAKAAGFMVAGIYDATSDRDRAELCAICDVCGHSVSECLTELGWVT